MRKHGIICTFITWVKEGIRIKKIWPARLIEIIIHDIVASGKQLSYNQNQRSVKNYWFIYILKLWFLQDQQLTKSTRKLPFLSDIMISTVKICHTPTFK